MNGINKKRTIMVCGIIISLLMIAGCSAEKESPAQGSGQEGPAEENTAEEESTMARCEKAGGTWKQFPDACVDSCKSQRKELMCAQVLTYGCGCGEGMCWNGKSCEELEAGKAEAREPETPVMNLTGRKDAVPQEITINKGDSVKFHNTEEEFYNNVVIIRERVNIAEPEDVIVQSGNIEPGESWEYQFNETGNFTIRDIYSDIRGKVTVE